jgi:hypothetical protein
MWLLLACTPRPAPIEQVPAVGPWVELEPGLELAALPFESALGFAKVQVVRVDPRRFTLELGVGDQATLETWATQGDWVAAINGGMFEPDWSTSTFLLHSGTLAAQPTWVEGANSVLIAPHKGPARLLDATCQDAQGAIEEVRKAGQGAAIQSYRLLDCVGAPTWQESDRTWSHSLLGQDATGRLLLIHARAPLDTRTFTQALLDLELDLTRLHYLDGGPPAAMTVRTPGFQQTWTGGYEDGLTTEPAEGLWEIPIALGVRRAE